MPGRNWLEQEFWRHVKPRKTEVVAKTAAFTTSVKQTGGVYTNLGASASVTATLNQSSSKGTRHTFVLEAQQPLVIDPGAAGGIYINGEKRADDASITSACMGNYITLVNDGNGDWIVTEQLGVWQLTADNLFSHAPIQQVMMDPSLGTFFMDDFVPYTAEGYTVYADTGGTIADLATEAGGAIRLLTDATDNDELHAQLGTATSAPFKFASSMPMWFEARIRTNTIADTKLPFFVGMAEEAAAASAFMGDAGALANLADMDWVGFFRTEADGDKLDTVHLTETGTATEVAADAVTLVADTWINVGWYCDGTTVTFYADGVALATTVAIAAAEFPDTEELSPIIGCKNASAAGFQLDMDWWWALQLK
jgi:hypothetical protein|tara:strand:- start:2950 stop:4050 length:1101 start_codon:yes stop_codon:yes gene_type:complete